MSSLRIVLLRLRTPICVAALAIILRLVAQSALGLYEHPIGFEEDIVARNIVQGRGYIYELNGTEVQGLRAPAYALFLAVIYLTFGDGSVQAGAAQSLLGGTLAVLAWAIGERLRPGFGLLAGMGAAADPALLVYSARIHPVNLEAVLFLAGVLLMLRLLDAPMRVVDWALLGLVAGLDLLTRPTFVPALALTGLVAAGLRFGRYGSGAATRPALVAIVTALVIVAPWSARNLAVLGTPALTTTTGLTLWLGNNPSASGGTVTSDGVSILDADPEIRDKTWGKPELEQDAIFTREALVYMTADPLRTMRSWLGKFAAFWWFAPQTGVFYPRLWLTIAVFFQAALLVLTTFGLAKLASRQQCWPLWVILSGALLTAATQALFYADGRHRFAIEPLLIIVALFGVVLGTHEGRAKLRALVAARSA